MNIRHLTIMTAATALIAFPLGLGGIISGADAAATPTCNGKTATIVLGADAPGASYGTDGDDVVVITSAATSVKTFDAMGGDDIVCVLEDRVGHIGVFGGDGSDGLIATKSPVNVHLHGGTGNDALLGSSGSDSLFGDSGNDTLNGAAGNDDVMPGTGQDVVSGGAGRDIWSSDDSANTAALTFNLHKDTVTGQGNDRVSNIETFVGAAGADTFIGGPENDTFYGGAGNDTMNGGKGNDFLDGQAGKDTLLGDDGKDTTVGGPGTDWCVAEKTQSCEM